MPGSDFKQFIANGVDLGFYGFVNSSGYFRGNDPTTEPAAGSGTGSPMKRVNGITQAPATVPAPTTQFVPGDNGTVGSFLNAPTETPSFALAKTVFDQLLGAYATGVKVFNHGNVSIVPLQPKNYDPPDMCWVLNSPSKKKDIGVDGVKAWSGYFIPLSSAYELGRDSFATSQYATDQIQVAATFATRLIDGTPITNEDFSTPASPALYFTSNYPLLFERFTGDGIQDEFTLTVPPAAAAELVICVNGVEQILTTDYTINLSTGLITFVDIPASASVIVCQVGFDPRAL